MVITQRAFAGLAASTALPSACWLSGAAVSDAQHDASPPQQETPSASLTALLPRAVDRTQRFERVFTAFQERYPRIQVEIIDVPGGKLFQERTIALPSSDSAPPAKDTKRRLCSL